MIGQIYVPVRLIHNLKQEKKNHFYHFQGINWILMLVTIAITLHFRTSANLAHACKAIRIHLISKIILNNYFRWCNCLFSDVYNNNTLYVCSTLCMESSLDIC